MGKSKKRFNQKARLVSSQDSSAEQKRNDELAKKFVDIGSSSLEYKLEHDTSNALVTHSRSIKRKGPKDGNDSKKPKKVLSKKEKKKLDLLRARKRKEKNRGDVLRSLSEHQISPEDLSLFKSTTAIGQVFHKREVSFDNKDVSDGDEMSMKSCKKKKKKNTEENIDDVIPLPPIKDVSEDEVDDDSSDDDDSESNSILYEQLEIDVGTGHNLIPFTLKNFIPNEEKSMNEGNCIQVPHEETSTESHPVKETEIKIDKVSDNETLISAGEDSQPVSKTEPIVTKTEPIQSIFVELKRNNEIQAARLLLPILPEEQVVMETVQENDVVIICGSTGSGKTTQVPQFLYEAGYGTHSSRSGIIGVTEPRRVAAISMSKRVAEEMNLSTNKVSYQIRFEGNTTNETKIKFMTDGVLLKEMEADFLLSKYSVIIIDEAHERSVYSDILIGMLTRIVPLRKKRGMILKLIIMSATLRIEDFTMNNLLFSQPPPVLKVDSRQYPVTIHFNKKTHDDYFTEAFRKVSKIHQSFKVDGGILVFLTGQREVLSFCTKLRKVFPKKECTPLQKSVIETAAARKDGLDILPKIDLDEYSILHDIPDEIEDTFENNERTDYSSGDEECTVAEYGEEFLSATNDYAPLHILPLYSLLPTKEQSKVFLDIPEGHRLCVVSTNVAETSLTIPGIKYIVDSGKVKTKVFDKFTGISKFMINWSSQASANQRAGRAGRTGPGHCYRLYSSAVFQNSFEDFTEPEIKCRPVEDLVLQMKNMHIEKVINFPFPSPPDQNALQAAEILLLELGALKKQKTKQGEELASITPLGKLISKIPVSPRFAKMIYLASKKGCLQYIITIAAALTVRDIFTDDIDLSDMEDIEDEDAKRKKILITRARRKWAGEGPSSDLGDLMVILRAVGASEYANCSEEFCKKNGLRLKSLTEIRKLRTQLTNSVNSVISEKISLDLKINPPTHEETLTIRQIVLSCLADHVARKFPPEQAKSLKLKNAYQCCTIEDPVYIHPTSSLFTKLPEYIVYHEMAETSKLFMKTVFSINENWLPLHAPHKCHLGKPLDEPKPFYDGDTGHVQCYRSSTYGSHMWPLPPQSLPYPDCTEKYRWFAKFFLDGIVCDKLEQFSSYLLTPSSMMLKSWSHLQQKTEDLLCSLMEKKITDKHKLTSEWQKDPKYLFFHYLKWLPESQHEHVKFIWPPM